MDLKIYKEGEEKSRWKARNLIFCKCCQLEWWQCNAHYKCLILDAKNLILFCIIPFINHEKEMISAGTVQT